MGPAGTGPAAGMVAGLVAGFLVGLWGLVAGLGCLAGPAALSETVRGRGGAVRHAL